MGTEGLTRLFQRDGLILSSSIKIARNCYVPNNSFVFFFFWQMMSLFLLRLLPQQHPPSIVLIYNTSKSSMFFLQMTSLFLLRLLPQQHPLSIIVLIYKYTSKSSMFFGKNIYIPPSCQSKTVFKLSCLSELHIYTTIQSTLVCYYCLENKKKKRLFKILWTKS